MAKPKGGALLVVGLGLALAALASRKAKAAVPPGVPELPDEPEPELEDGLPDEPEPELEDELPDEPEPELEDELPDEPPEPELEDEEPELPEAPPEEPPPVPELPEEPVAPPPAPAPPAPAPSPVKAAKPTEPSKPGMGRRKVSVLQNILRRMGADPTGLTDGKWGPKTSRAWIDKAFATGNDPAIDRAAPTFAWVMPATFRALQAAAGLKVQPIAPGEPAPVAPAETPEAPTPPAPVPAPEEPVAPEAPEPVLPEPEEPEPEEPAAPLVVSSALRSLALLANNAAAIFTAKRGSPPAVGLPAVGKFQAAINEDFAAQPQSLLEPMDAVWGPNTLAAALWVLKKTGTVPPMSPQRFRSSATWQPPVGAVAVADVDAPAPPEDAEEEPPLADVPTPAAAEELKQAAAAVEVEPEEPPPADVPAAPSPPAGYDPAKAKNLAKQVVSNLGKGVANFSRELLRSFQRAAGIGIDGRYGGGSRGALIHYGIRRPPEPFTSNKETRPYPWA